MILDLRGPVLRTPETTDFSDITASVQTAPAEWVSPTQLQLFWDVEPSANEAKRIMLRICTPDAVWEQAFITLRQYFNNAAPTATDTQNAVKALARLMLRSLSASAE